MTDTFEPSCRFMIPPGTWDSRIHIVDPINNLLGPNATYAPNVFAEWDNALLENNPGAEHNVIVQPSSMDTTTRRRWRSVAESGVRGVRVNLGFVDEKTSVEDFKKTPLEYASAAQPLDWTIQLCFEMSFVAALEDFLSTVGVDVVLDHMGHPDIPDSADVCCFDPYTIEGFGSLSCLLQDSKV
ncbi:uncharacterized protein F5Z01DRAFT_634741 [Emericellopsis atlantica]|uniref:Amidohydrolase-related domain-containing protein n=1 Tax=Emericellopsis atlantica TaxID=2614577 RepID=A0A9P8CR72_9HYPO|nr:uncharacterized protein F5Z01DRAFT_634741 [Emericellopsis atlantica]KAG9256423.1 hypothetical protein F5Z01DRAFT_634741 [Emericellopsis atlantica]